jgi:hypothetical protein
VLRQYCFHFSSSNEEYTATPERGVPPPGSWLLAPDPLAPGLITRSVMATNLNPEP